MGNCLVKGSNKHQPKTAQQSPISSMPMNEPSTMSPTSFNHLPQDLLVQIASHLNPIEQLHLSYCNRQLRKIMLSPMLLAQGLQKVQSNTQIQAINELCQQRLVHAKTTTYWHKQSSVPHQRALLDKHCIFATLSQNGHRLLTFSKLNQAQLWDTNHFPAKHLYTFPATLMRCANLTYFSQDNSKLALPVGGNTLQLWDLGIHPPQSRILMGDRMSVCTSSFSPDDQKIAITYLDGMLKIWPTTPSTKPVMILRHPQAPIASIQFTKDSQSIRVACIDGTVRTWDLRPSLPSVAMSGTPQLSLHGVHFSPNHDSMVQHQRNGSLNWTRMQQSPLCTTMLYQLSSNKSQLIFSPDGNHMMALGQPRGIPIWHMLQPSSPPKWLKHQAQACIYACFSTDSRWVLTTSAQGKSHLWDLAYHAMQPLDLPQVGEKIIMSMFAGKQGQVLLLTQQGKAYMYQGPATNPYPFKTHLTPLSTHTS